MNSAVMKAMTKVYIIVNPTVTDTYLITMMTRHPPTYTHKHTQTHV